MNWFSRFFRSKELKEGGVANRSYDHLIRTKAEYQIPIGRNIIHKIQMGHWLEMPHRNFTIQNECPDVEIIIHHETVRIVPKRNS